HPPPISTLFPYTTLFRSGVLLIAEHGDYPYNAKGQKLYPRHEYFQKIVEVFRRSGKSVPVFCDKHLSYDRKKGREMVETARRMRSEEHTSELQSLAYLVC